ncbi:DUF3606 domain-containing protein [Pedobacter sp. GR22-6]|uniref:DUF3606 domain-containing protein n=1 Tax=Pedobacter sp. GR22-6 TaxID=3127957 RepID=UPI00307D4CAD
MEDKQTSAQQMEALGGQLKSTFPLEKVVVSSQASHFELYFNESVVDKAAQVKAIHDFIQPYLVEHGDPTAAYQFNFYRDRELIDILHFNDPDAAHHISMELSGKTQNLRIQDVLGATGDYTIFNEDFQQIGWLSAVAEPPVELDITLLDPDSTDFYSDQVYPNFNNPAIWQIEPEALKPYLDEILSKVLEEFNSKAETFEVDVDEPDDVAFWAEQFEISEEELRKAILAAGKSIDDITAYLQH